MNFKPTRLAQVVLVEPRVFEDSRGCFMETWEERKFSAAGLDVRFVQDNHSVSRQWVLRGLHYQIDQPQGKLVRVVRGEAFDVAVDMRRSSPTFGKWVGETLSAANRRMLWIPPGFAHGFLALGDSVEFLYKCTAFYRPSAERTLIWDDPAIGIQWPLPPGIEPIVSDKDRLGKPLTDAECYA
jgi:dTDP-4-dehydrorhamnose 3,5-epimerase